MAIKRGSKVDKSFSSASMTDLMFLLLLFLLIATTLINPNAIKLMLPNSNNMLKDKAITTVSIESTPNGYRYYVELESVDGIEGMEKTLLSKLEGVESPTVSLHCDKDGVTIGEVVKVMNVAKKHGYSFILATSAN
ncbi:MAG: biopolymer transporter ExbD [Rikenellaceae bacterium]